MATRTGYVGTTSDGQVLTSANFTKLPNGGIAYVSATADQTGITAGTNLTNLSLVITPNANRLIKISCCAHVGRTVNDGVSVLSIRQNTTNIQNFSYSVSTNNSNRLVTGFTLLSAPAASSTTWRLMLTQVTGTGTSFLSAASDSIAWLMVEDIGPSF